MRRSMILAMCVGLIAAAPLAVRPTDAAERIRPGRGGEWWTSTEVQESLGLTPEQVQEITDIQASKREAMIAARRQLMKAYRQIVTALDESAEPRAELAQRQQDLEKAWLSYLHVDMDSWMDLRGVLSEEQWKDLPNVAPRALRLGMIGLRARGRVNAGGEEQ